MENVVEGNKLIALFMGYTEDEVQAEDWCGCNVLANVNPAWMVEEKTMVPARYDESWDWLLPVVRRIKYGDAITGKTFVTATEVSHESNRRYRAIENSLRNLSLDQTWLCVFRFIQWYNQNLINNGK